MDLGNPIVFKIRTIIYSDIREKISNNNFIGHIYFGSSPDKVIINLSQTIFVNLLKLRNND